MTQSRRYASLLLITASQDTAAQFARLIPAERFAPEFNVCSPREAEYILRESPCDVIAVDSSIDWPTASAIAVSAAGSASSLVLLISEPEHIEEAAALGEAHGFMALPSPADPLLLKQSLGLMASTSARIRALEERAGSLESKMEELRIVDRAKLILVQQFKMSEKEAHRFIEKNAMDRSVKRRDVAESIIRTYQN